MPTTEALREMDPWFQQWGCILIHMCLVSSDRSSTYVGGCVCAGENFTSRSFSTFLLIQTTSSNFFSLFSTRGEECVFFVLVCSRNQLHTFALFQCYSDPCFIILFRLFYYLLFDKHNTFLSRFK